MALLVNLKRYSFWLTLGCVGLFIVSGCDDTVFPPGPAPQPAPPPDPVDPGTTERPKGQTDFTSADGNNGQTTQRNEDEDMALGAPDAEASPEMDSDEAGSGAGGGEDRSVEEGDIYRVLESKHIANLNSYRGLQIIDFDDVESPKIIGRLQISGSPVEMYVAGSRVFVLLNNWYGYCGNLYQMDVESLQGGVVISVDISDPTDPVLTDQVFIPGNIKTSRMTFGENANALYVISSHYDYWEVEGQSQWETRTHVASFDVTSGSLIEKESIDLGGYVQDIQATTEALLVSRQHWDDYSSYYSRISVVDISDPHGSMIEGGEVSVAGWVNNQFNMDLYKGILRIVSTDSWGSTDTNHLQTFDARDIGNLTEIDHVTFGDNESLFATHFVGNKAFFVTYLRTDPFHAFYIDDDGQARQMSEFIISGWNDFFRPVLDDTRLVGIGMNDEEGRTMAVSLYDITDLSNPDPLVSRSEVEASYSWSEASWDHRAFSIVENAVQVNNSEGTLETGLVLLPFTGWDDDYNSYLAGVQIFTFSKDTLTRRGLMIHGTPVRRGFLAEANTTANLSDSELSFFDVSDPDQPGELGRVELAPNFTEVLIFGDYVARVKNSSDDYYGWWGSDIDLPPATIEVVPRSEHPDTSQVVAQIEIPSNAQVRQSGDLLVALTTNYTYKESGDGEYESQVRVYDFSNPRQPYLAGSLTTDRPLGGYGYHDWWYGSSGIGMEDCWDCGYGYGYSSPQDSVANIESGLVFLQRHTENEFLGNEEYCYTYATEYEDCDLVATTVDPEGATDSSSSDDGLSSANSCWYYSGSITCRSLAGAEPNCSGEIQKCAESESSGWECQSIDEESIPTETNCYEYETYRYWQRFSLDVLDLRDPTEPVMAQNIVLPTEEEGVSMLADGSDIWLTFKEPAAVNDDSRQYVRYFIRRIGLQDPQVPVLGKSINVPGELLAINDSTIYTRDNLWGDEIIETSIAKLQLHNGLAYLQAIRVFVNQVVEAVVLDGQDRVLVSHRQAWQAYENETEENLQQLTVLDVASEDLAILAEVDVDSWASLKDARAGRALFQVSGGLLVFNLDDPALPYPQAFFATRGWPQDILVADRDIIFAAGRFGIYAFDLDTFNLLDLQQ